MCLSYNSLVEQSRARKIKSNEILSIRINQCDQNTLLKIGGKPDDWVTNLFKFNLKTGGVNKFVAKCCCMYARIHSWFPYFILSNVCVCSMRHIDNLIYVCHVIALALFVFITSISNRRLANDNNNSRGRDALYYTAEFHI